MTDAKKNDNISIPKVYVLDKAETVPQIFFDTDTELSRASALYFSCYVNLVTAGVVGSLKITASINGSIIDVYGGPADSSAYGSPWIIYRPKEPINVPNRAYITITTWDDAGVSANYAGKVVLKMMYES